MSLTCYPIVIWHKVHIWLWRRHKNLSLSSPCAGARINQADKSGRTPLHLAAAVDYPDMVKYLVDNGADIHARTFGELQSPIHFAARNDAVNSLKMLLNCGANTDDRDFKNRTPLHVSSNRYHTDVA